MIMPIAFVTCFQSGTKNQRSNIFPGYWVSKNLGHYSVDSSLGGGQTIYGSGYLLKLDSNGQATSLGADFYWKNDSLFQGGEPGITLKIGNWESRGQLLLLQQKLISKSFILPSDRIGRSEVDTVFLEPNSSMIYGQDTLILVKKPSRELQLFVDKISLNKNGS